MRVTGVMSATVAAAMWAGCGDFFQPTEVDVQLADVTVETDVRIDPTVGKGVGQACDAAVVGDCRYGLSCLDGTCRATGDAQENRPCILTDECGDGLYCSLLGACRDAGAVTAGGACSTAADCEPGLVCRSFGFSGACVAAGSGDLGAACDAVDDCLAGLSCGGDGKCAAGSPTFGLELWGGVECPADPGPDEAPVVHFEIPRGAPPAAGTDTDFFRLPFPNDIRMKDGHVDLSGFPTPGPGIVGFDPVQRIMDAAAQVQTGFSTEPVVTFRLSHGFKLETVRASDEAGPVTLYFRNIDKASPQYNWTPDYAYFVTDGGSAYICPRYVTVRPTWNGPLLPGTTYAVILARGIETTDGADFGATDDMQAMLSTFPPDPGSASLTAAWNAYAKLRDYVADPVSGVASERVIAAAVFTTQRVDDVLPALRAAIQAAPAAAPEDLTECKAGVTSPCDDGLTGEAHVRGCFTESDQFHELHLRIPLPRVQAGTRPYLAPEDGGGLAFGADGAGPVLQGTESVCAALTIPKNQPMPEAGWPIAIYGHGTGGSFRSAVRDAAEPLSAITVSGGDQVVGVATLGWDGPMHGARQKDGQAVASLDPGALFYNLGNPLAARGNLYQGAADVFALVRAVKGWSVVVPGVNGGAPIHFDPAKILLIGHSQGATTAPLASPYEPDVHAVIWSGAGGGLVLSLLGKTSPLDVPLAAAVALQEIDGGGPVRPNELHPALGLVQGLFDAVDPLNHGRAATAQRAAELGVQHVLMSYGIGDTFTPNATGRAFARVMSLPVARPVIEDFGPGFATVDLPLKENAQEPAGRATNALVQARPDGYDGHFVLFRDATLRRQYQQWVGTFVRDGVPTLVP